MLSLQDQRSAVKDHSVNVGKRPVSICACERERARGEGDIITMTVRWPMEGHHGFLPSAFILCECEHIQCVHLWIHCNHKHTVTYTHKTNVICPSLCLPTGHTVSYYVR